MSAGIQRNPANASAEQMPHLEPLDESDSEASLLHHHPSIEPPLPPLLVAPRQITPRDRDRHADQVVRDAISPFQLSLVLENKGNVARDHLASERTYLAYVRTSLACASAGAALVKLFTPSGATATGVDLTKFAKHLGATFILFGLIILVVGVVRYFTTQSALVRGYFPVARHSISMIAFVLGSLVGVVFTFAVTGPEHYCRWNREVVAHAPVLLAQSERA